MRIVKALLADLHELEMALLNIIGGARRINPRESGRLAR